MFMFDGRDEKVPDARGSSYDVGGSSVMVMMEWRPISSDPSLEISATGSKCRFVHEVAGNYDSNAQRTLVYYNIIHASLPDSNKCAGLCMSMAFALLTFHTPAR